MVKAKRILMAVHPHFRPDRGPRRISTEQDVWGALIAMGHNVRVAGVTDDISELERTISEFSPHIVFNLLEEYRGEAIFDFHVVTRLESLGVPYTGCNPRGLILSRNKYLTGLVAEGLGICTPKSWLLNDGGRDFVTLKKIISRIEYPLFLKLNREHSSLGIRESNRVSTLRQLHSTYRRLKSDFGSEILLQQFIPGEDVTVSVWGNGRCQAFAPRNLPLGGKNRVSTARVKFSPSEWRKRSILSEEFKSPVALRLRNESLKLYRHLDMSGYARFDFRVQEDHKSFLIDVNANPNLCKDEDFVVSSGVSYEKVLERIIDLGLRYQPKM